MQSNVNCSIVLHFMFPLFSGHSQGESQRTSWQEKGRASEAASGAKNSKYMP